MLQRMGIMMPLIGVRIAAGLTSKDRSTIIRAIEDGRLSASKDARGRYQIDPAELERVYGTLGSPDALINAPTDAMPQHASGQAMRITALEREIELLRAMQRQWEDERSFLRGMLERTSEQVKLLTDQRNVASSTATDTSAMMMPSEAPRRGWWRRIFRKN